MLIPRLKTENMGKRKNMKSKRNLILVSILGVLIVVSLIKKVTQRQESIVEEAAFRKLASAKFEVSDINRVEIYKGDKAKEKIVMAKDSGGWLVKSYFNAPVKEQKINDFIDKVRDIEGEFRSESSEVLKDFNISDDKAIHVAFFKAGSKEPASHVLIGKTAGSGGAFVRLAGENKIYTVDANLIADIGVQTASKGGAPKANNWLDLAMLKLDKNSVSKMEVTTPARSVTFEKQEVKEDKKLKAGPPPVPGKDKSNTKKYEWKITKGKYTKIKENAMKQMLGALSSLAAVDVVDPARLKEVGLNKPSYRLAIVKDDGKKEVLVASRFKGDVYAMLQGSKNSLYKLANYNFENVFKKGDTLFDLQGINVAPAEIKELTIKTPKSEFAFARLPSHAWDITKPFRGVALLQSGLSGVSDAIAKWKPVDYSDLSSRVPASAPYVISFVYKDGKKTVLHVNGQMIEGSVERYCRLEAAGKSSTFIISEGDFERLFPEKGKILDMKVASFAKDNVDFIKFISKKERFSASKKSGKWTVELADGKKYSANNNKIKNFLSRLEIAEAKEIFLNKGVNPKKGAKAGIRLKETGKKEIDLFIHDEGNTVWVQALGGKFKYVFDSSKARFLFPESSSLAIIREDKTAAKPTVKVQKPGAALKKPSVPTAKGKASTVVFPENGKHVTMGAK